MLYQYGHGLLSLPVRRASIFKQALRYLERIGRDRIAARNEAIELARLADYRFIERLDRDGTRAPLDPATGLDELDRLLRQNRLIITDGNDHFAVKVSAHVLKKHLEMNGNRAVTYAAQIRNNPQHRPNS